MRPNPEPTIGLGRALRRLIVLVASAALVLPAQAVWLAPPAAAVSCPTGTTSVGSTGCQVTFAASTTWTIPTGVSSVEVVAVGGGGGGGGNQDPRSGLPGAGGGGGGGQVVEATYQAVTPGASATMTVGAGGSGGPDGPGNGTSGGTSSFVATGVSVSAAGGSPGAGGFWGAPYAGGTGYGGASGAGYAGGKPKLSVGGDPTTWATYFGGGGGGSSAPGGDAREIGGGNGGAGTVPSAGLFAGSTTAYAGGGGGGHGGTTTSPGDGVAGGGDGNGSTTDAGGAATANTGGGGGGTASFTNGSGGDGGSGIVIVRFLVPGGSWSQAITFTSQAPSNAVYGETYTPTATATSGLAVSFTSATSSICSITAGMVRFTGVGTCTINANQDGNTTYKPAPQVQQTFNVDKSSQMVGWSSPPPSNAAVGGSWTATGFSSSGLTVTFIVDSGSSSICSIDARNLVTFTAAGYCAIRATQAGNADYYPANPVLQSFTVAAAGPAAQTISFSSTAPTNAAVGGPTYTAVASATSDLTVALTIDASATSFCSIDDGGVISFLAGGTCTIDANQGGNASYKAAAQVQQSFSVAAANPGFTPTGTGVAVTPAFTGGTSPVTVTFGTVTSAGTTSLTTGTTPPAPVPAGYLAGSETFFDLQTTATYDGPITVCFSYAGTTSGPTNLLHYDAATGSWVDITSSADTTTQVTCGTTATLSPFALVAALQSQTITFTSTAPTVSTIGGASYTPTAIGGASGKPVVFTIDTSAASVCAINGSGVVSLNGVGTCTINANQDGNASYDAAPEAQQSFAVTAAAPAILYVKTGGLTTGSCDTWDNACASPSYALGLAEPGSQVWVAAGTYTPSTAGLSDPRAGTFPLKTGVAVYGGFAGTGTSLDQRDVTANVTTLSGDIGTVGDSSDNAYHVVTGSGTGATAILDGFTVSGGNANGSFVSATQAWDRGGGMFTYGGSPTLANIGFTNNHAAYWGGGQYNNTANPTLTNVSFTGNTASGAAAGSGGGGMCNYASSPTLTNVTFSGNTVVNGPGGGIYDVEHSNLTLTDVAFTGNVASNGHGGGMANDRQSSATLTDATFTENQATAAGSAGGGIHNVGGSSAKVTNATFTGNTTDGTGGAIANDTSPTFGGGTATLTNVKFIGNTAYGDGGAIVNDHSTTVATDTTFTGNTAGAGGGAMSSWYSTVTLSRVVFDGNSAAYSGGATFAWYGSATVTDAVYSNNRAVSSGGMGGSGGAVMIDFNATNTFTNVTFSGNTAVGYGAAIWNNGNGTTENHLFLTNVTIAGNSAGAWYDVGYGALRIDGGSGHKITNVTMTDNVNGGLLQVSSASVIRNTIIWGNSGYQVRNNSSTADIAHSIVQGGWDGIANTNVDPMLATLGDHDGFASTRPPLPGSPAIDAGDGGICPAADERGVTRPQGGACDIGAVEARPFTLAASGGDNQAGAAGTVFPLPLEVTATGDDPVIGGKVTFSAPDPENGPSATLSPSPVTIGADATAGVTATATGSRGTYTVSATTAGANTVQFTMTNQWGTLYVKPGGVATGSCGTWSHACTLAHALAMASSGDEVWVAAGTHVPDATTQTDPADLRTATFQLANGVAIYGGFAGTETSRSQRNPATRVTTLSGDLDGNDDADPGTRADNAYHVATASGTDATAVLDGFTISGGHASSETSPNDVGGGMLVLSGSPTLRAVTFTGNYGWNGGGGMYTKHGDPTVVDSTFDGNTTTGYGAGIQNLQGSPRLTGVVFSDNTAVHGFGGGLYSGGYVKDTPAVSPTLTGVTFIDNSAIVGGGMANSLHSSSALTNVTFVGNTAAEGGGGMHNFYYSDPTLVNVTFVGNSGGTGSGGAISNANHSSPTLTNVTFYDNTAVTGGAMSSGGNCNPTVTNSVLWGDTGGEIGDTSNCTTAITYSAVQGGHVGEGNVDAELLLGPLGTYPAGAATQTLPLLPGSAAIDAADAASCPATDQRGIARPKGAGCDMGAYEASTFTMTISGGDGQGALANADFDDPLTVTVTGSGDPVAGGKVIFSAPGTGASATLTGRSATIGSDGTASVTATANGTLGAYEVSASAAGANTVSFSLRNAGILHATPAGRTDGACESWENACTLDYALTLAGAGSQVWVAAGTHTPTWPTDAADPRTATFGIVSGVRLYGGFAGDETSLGARDPATNVTVLSGDLAGDDGADFANNDDNAYQVVTGVDLAAATTVDGFTIRGGNANAQSRYQGGGLYVTGSPAVTGVTFDANYAWNGGGMWSAGSPALTRVTFAGNSALVGGGLYSYSGNPTLRNVTFEGNTTIDGGQGGGMYVRDGNPTLTDVTFTDNSVSDGGSGGGLFLSATAATLTRVTFRDNTAYRGGGMRNQGSSALVDVVFDGNSAANAGGGMYTDYGVPTLTRATFAGNTAAYGGGLWADRSSPRLTNATFTDNEASTIGGAAYLGMRGRLYIPGTNSSYPVNVVMTNATFSGNSAGEAGGAIYDTDRATVRSSILWGDTAPTGPEIFVSNCCSGSVTVSQSDIQGGYGGTGNINADPLLGPLGSYGGFVQTLPLLPGSPAIETVAPDAYASGSGSRCGSDVAADGRGIARPQGTLCDMGAYEARPFTLTTGGGGDQSALIDTAFPDPLEVTVTSPSGDPVAGGTVVFTAPGSGASATLAMSPALIGADGTASVTATANDTEGDYTVTASASGAAGTASFELANIVQIAPAFAFDLSTLAARTFGDDAFSVVEYASKPDDDAGAITFALGDGSLGCEVTSDGTVTIEAATGTGECVIEASLAEDTHYLAAGPLSQGFGIAKATPTFTGIAVDDATYDGQPHRATADVSGVGDPAEDLGSAGVSYELRGGSEGAYTYGEPTATAPTDAGAYRVTLAYAGSTNHVGISDISRLLTIAKATLTVTANDQSRPYGDPDPVFDATITGFVHGETRATSGVTGTPVCTTTATGTSPASPPTYPITCTAGSLSANSYDFAFVAGALTVTKATLTVTAENTSVQYSDPMPVLTWTFAGFKNGETLATSGVTGSPTCATPATSTSGVGLYPISCTIGTLGARNYDFTFVNGTLTVTQEDARAYYTGDSLFWGTSATASSATVTLMATVKDITADADDPAYDASAGDISHATVTFVNRDPSIAPLDGCSGVSVALVSSGDSKVGTAVCTTTLGIGSSGATLYTIGIVVSGYYTDDASIENAVITVAAPITSYFITGGGFLAEARSAGTYAADPGTKANFGFNVKFNKGAKNLQGNLNIIFRRGGHTFQIKSNALTSLGETPSPCSKATATSPCKANFVSKANLRDITNPNSPVSLGGNLIFQMSMTDYGSPTKDTIGFSLYNGSALLFSSNWSGTKTVEQLLGGGSLSVR